MAPMEVIREQVAYLQQAIAAIRRVRELLSTSSRLTDGVELIPDGPLSVDFDAVSFGYADGDADGPGPAVLDELSFHLDKGRRLGLVGRTGAGKTTIAHLLFRMYDPQGGRVLLGGVDLATARIASVRSRVGFVTQDVHIFSASLRDNLTFFDSEISDQRLTEILDHVGLAPWLESLPNGLSTPISGDTVSVGQGQLIGLARVFIKDPGLVILDEPSSYLDPATEAMLMTALDSLLAGRTAVLISHSLATFSRADEILMIEEGRIAEYGGAGELLSDPGSRLAQLRGLGGG
jgi:ATP-binding cassette, subfamily B, bacterial